MSVYLWGLLVLPVLIGVFLGLRLAYQNKI